MSLTDEDSSPIDVFRDSLSQIKRHITTRSTSITHTHAHTPTPVKETKQNLQLTTGHQDAKPGSRNIIFVFVIQLKVHQ